jgi:hypothetical protein
MCATLAQSMFKELCSPRVFVLQGVLCTLTGERFPGRWVCEYSTPFSLDGNVKVWKAGRDQFDAYDRAFNHWLKDVGGYRV